MDRLIFITVADVAAVMARADECYNDKALGVALIIKYNSRRG